MTHNIRHLFNYYPMTKEIRKYYGIPQQLMADNLKVPRSQLSMSESSRRNLNPLSTIGLVPLLQDMFNPTQKTTDKELVMEQAIQKGNDIPD